VSRHSHVLFIINTVSILFTDIYLHTYATLLAAIDIIIEQSGLLPKMVSDSRIIFLNLIGSYSYSSTEFWKIFTILTTVNKHTDR
jgi:hypothetical protein